MMKKINYFEVVPKLKTIITGGVVMTLATALLFALHINVLLNIMVSAIVYFAILAALREPLLTEIRVIFGLRDTKDAPRATGV